MSEEQRWYEVAHTSDLNPGEVMYIEIGDEPAALVNLEGAFYALSDICTHQDASLSDGEVIGDEIECPLHGGAFEIKTGMPANFPVVVPVETYDVKVEGEIVYAAKRASS